MIDKKVKINPTQEMQEVLDTFWNSAKSTENISTQYRDKFGVEN